MSRYFYQIYHQHGYNYLLLIFFSTNKDFSSTFSGLHTHARCLTSTLTSHHGPTHPVDFLCKGQGHAFGPVARGNRRALPGHFSQLRHRGGTTQGHFRWQCSAGFQHQGPRRQRQGVPGSDVQLPGGRGASDRQLPDRQRVGCP